MPEGPGRALGPDPESFEGTSTWVQDPKVQAQALKERRARVQACHDGPKAQAIKEPRAWAQGPALEEPRATALERAQAQALTAPREGRYGSGPLGARNDEKTNLH